MTRPSVRRFILALQQQPDTNVIRNPYRNPQRAKNLRAYLLAMLKETGPRVLLVGEAPGYRGCGITGIPFSCGGLFERFEHPFLQRLYPRLAFESMEHENTATIVWEYLTHTGYTPLFWNAFPFHPHAPGNPRSNRAPTRAEVAEGAVFLEQLVALYRPDCIAGIGRKGHDCVRRVFPDREVALIRHPSYGGKRDFVQGMSALYQSMGLSR